MEILSEKKLQYENFYRLKFDNVPDAFIAIDEEGKTVAWDELAEKNFGWRADEIVGISIYDTLFSGTPFQISPIEENGKSQDQHADGLARQIKVTACHKGGSLILASITLIPFHAAGTLNIAGIRKLREQEATLKQQLASLQQQASLLDLTRDAIIVRAAQSDTITYWNTGAERLYQYTRQEATGQVIHDLLCTEFPMPYEQIQAVVAEAGFWEGELIQTTRNGQEIIVHSQWVMEALEGQPQRYLETNTDITQRIQAERALAQSQESYRLLVEASTEYAIIMLDPGGIIISWNPGAAKVLRLTEKEALGQPISTIFATEDEEGRPLRALKEALTTGRSENDCWHIRRDGSRFWATGVVTPLWNQDGSLRGYVKIMRDETEQRVEEEGTQFLAHHDGLTGLHNRVSFSNELHKAIARAERTKIPFAVLLLDLDRFKNVNDTLGHHAGDLLLKEVALRIQSSVRETDFVARLGGDEFVVIQYDVSLHDTANTLAGKLVNELGKPYVFENMKIVSGASIGIAVYPKHASNSVELLKRADLAMYRAKHAGRHNYQFYSSDLEENWKENRAHALRKALQNHKFELYYQPQVDLENWKITAVEALLRWHATELDLVLPNEFLAVAEETGIIVEIGEWALRQASLQVKQWQEQGLSDLRISLNCSARQFSDPKFVAMIPSILDDTGLAHGFLELEVSESLLALRPEIKEQLIQLRTLGVRITIDNFGTGNIALMDLKDLAVDALKIDKEFVRHLPHRRQDSAITSAIISLARDLGVDVIAGGVETAEQLAYLKAQHCASAQGFIFSPPLSSEKFTALISGDGWSGLNRTLPYHPIETPQNLH
jgi:diguanylate cyclase (GGDEF)-like protein/PAS domain S-box-containing protein